MAADPHRSALQRLVVEVRDIVAERLPAQPTADRVAEVLRPAVQGSELLAPEHRRGSATEYTQHVLHVEPDGSFSVVALVWLPGQQTCVHDHVSWCTVGVHRGQEAETQYRVDDNGGAPRLRPTVHRINECGSVCGIAPPGDIHHVANDGDTTAISLHVYGADIGQLGSSIRRRYDLPVVSFNRFP